MSLTELPPLPYDYSALEPYIDVNSSLHTCNSRDIPQILIRIICGMSHADHGPRGAAGYHHEHPPHQAPSDVSFRGMLKSMCWRPSKQTWR